jgi:LuxR family transcriptional regulator, maltose regulon positive regulatory protein
MESSFQTNHDSTTSYHFERPRLNTLFLEAVKYPLIVVCAGAGYGKTTAVHDFLKEYNVTTAWIQLSERDNVGARFWENYSHSISKISKPLAEAVSKVGFPDTKENLRHYKSLIREYTVVEKRILVIDDFHCIEDSAVLRFMEEGFFKNMLPESTIFLISRSLSRLNVAGMFYRDQIYNVNESDLRFTENELAQYFRRVGVSFQPDSLREIMQDTEGWAFAINLIARSSQKAPGYGGYVRNAMKQNIFRLLETEIWDEFPEQMRNFLVRLSLIDHLSVDLIAELAAGDEGLIAGMEKQSAYVRLDSYINAYLIHPLFLEFLTTKQELLSEEQKRETYAISGDWCNRNGFKIDALSYYEKIRDYQSIVKMFFELPLQIPLDVCRYAAPIFENALPQDFYKVEFFAEMHLRSYFCQGLLEKALELIKYYEEKFLVVPEDNDIKRRTLARIYICWGYLRGLMCLKDDVLDFDIYMGKAGECVSTSVDPGKLSPHCPAMWIICAGSSRKGVLEEYIDAVTRTQKHLSRSNLRGLFAGEPELARCVMEFYRGNMSQAESYAALALKNARENKQYGLIHRTLFYVIRIAAAQGDSARAEQALKETKELLDEPEYQNRFIDYDISLSWYYCFLGLPEKTPDWLQEDFSSYSHAGFLENSWNQIKARFYYATRNFAPVLAYIEEMKTRESFLLERIEKLVIEACIHYKMKDKKNAFAALRAAYTDAESNNIVMPFIEMGKDMRTLASAMLKESDNVIPEAWLEDINRKSASYAKRRANMVAEYMQVNRVTDSPAITPREEDILNDLSHGLSRAEIASSRGLSINTVKMVINSLYFKLGAQNLADLIRIATERKMI